MAAVHDDVYEVERLLDVRSRKKHTQYLVRWVGWAPKYDSWEDVKSIHTVELIAQFERQLANRRSQTNADHKASGDGTATARIRHGHRAVCSTVRLSLKGTGQLVVTHEGIQRCMYGAGCSTVRLSLKGATREGLQRCCWWCSRLYGGDGAAASSSSSMPAIALDDGGAVDGEPEQVVARTRSSQSLPLLLPEKKLSARKREIREEKLELKVRAESDLLAASSKGIVPERCLSSTGFVGVFSRPIKAPSKVEVEPLRNNLGKEILRRPNTLEFYAECFVEGEKKHLGVFPTAALAALERARTLRESKLSQPSARLTRAKTPAPPSAPIPRKCPVVSAAIVAAAAAASAAAAAAACAAVLADADAQPFDRGKALEVVKAHRQKCRRCGLPETGHTCLNPNQSGPPFMMPPKLSPSLQQALQDAAKDAATPSSRRLLARLGAAVVSNAVSRATTSIASATSSRCGSPALAAAAAAKAAQDAAAAARIAADAAALSPSFMPAQAVPKAPARPPSAHLDGSKAASAASEPPALPVVAAETDESPPQTAVIAPADVLSHLLRQWPLLCLFVSPHFALGLASASVELVTAQAIAAASVASDATAALKTAAAVSTSNTLRKAATEGLTLQLSASSTTGFKGVSSLPVSTIAADSRTEGDLQQLRHWPTPYVAKPQINNGLCGGGLVTTDPSLGEFSTPAEAALCRSRHAEQVRLAQQHALSQDRQPRPCASTKRRYLSDDDEPRDAKTFLRPQDAPLGLARGSQGSARLAHHAASRRRSVSIRALTKTVRPSPSPAPQSAPKRPKLLPAAAQGWAGPLAGGRVRIGKAHQALVPRFTAPTPNAQLDYRRVSRIELETAEAVGTAALLTASAYGPMNAWSFVAPSDCGLGLFARVALRSNQAVGEYGGPRLPSRFHTNGQYVLQVPGVNEIIDGAYENSPYDDGARWPVVFANHSRVAPNARLEYWPTTQPEACELRGRLWVVTDAPISAGSEIRLDYEAGEARGTYWLDGPPPETGFWRTHRVQPPPPTAEEPVCQPALQPLQQPAEREEVAICNNERLPWEGTGGGDERLKKLVSLFVNAGREDRPHRTWGLVATHLPGRTGRECFDRWTCVHLPAPFAAIPTAAIPAAAIPAATLAATVTAASATASGAGGFAAALGAAAQSAVAAQAAEEEQWRLHQQRLAAQQRAKMQAQAALVMAHAQQQAAATPSLESGKRPREEGRDLAAQVSGQAHERSDQLPEEGQAQAHRTAIGQLFGSGSVLFDTSSAQAASDIVSEESSTQGTFQFPALMCRPANQL